MCIFGFVEVGLDEGFLDGGLEEEGVVFLFVFILLELNWLKYK